MASLMHFMLKLKRKIFQRQHKFVPTSGIPYILGQGLTTPYIEPKIMVHWHPPFAAMPSEEPVKKKNRFPSWLNKLGIRRK